MYQRSPEEIPGYWRVAIVEDHVLQRERTEQVMTTRAGFRVVFSGSTLTEFITWLRGADPRRRPQLLVLDLLVDRAAAADPAAVRSLVDEGIRVLVLSAMASPPLVREMLRSGVGGVVGKQDSAEDIVDAAWAAILGEEQWLTPDVAGIIAADTERPELSIQEERTLVLYASGLTLEEVASTMHVKPDTAKTYLNRVKAKYDAVGRPVSTKIDLNREAQVDGFLSGASTA